MNRDEFVKQYYVIANRALEFKKKSRREGILATEDDIDGKKADGRDIFEYGMRFVVNGVDAYVIRDILSNIADQEKDENIKLLKTIQKEAVIGIQYGINPFIFMSWLNSYTDLSLKEDEVFSKFIAEYFA
ncbi:hypothetical protein R84B8_01643 [Treponema sp. R8-4-B8]